MRAHHVSPEAPFLRKCAWCGQEFGAASPQAQYCSRAHKQAHYRWRSKVGQFGREAIVRIEYLSEYGAKGGEVGEAALRQIEALIKRATQVKSATEAKLRRQEREKVDP